MPLLLLALLVFVEISLMVRAADAIGGLNVFVLIAATAVAGVTLSRSLRAGMMQRFQRDLGEGRVPQTQIVESFLMLFAGLLLVIPGFLTDAFGAALLLPFVRRPIAEKLRARFASGQRGGVFMQMGARGMGGFPPGGFGAGGFGGGGEGGFAGDDDAPSARAPDGTPIRDVPVVQHPPAEPRPRDALPEGDDPRS